MYELHPGYKNWENIIIRWLINQTDNSLNSISHMLEVLVTFSSLNFLFNRKHMLTVEHIIMADTIWVLLSKTK